MALEPVTYELPYNTALKHPLRPDSMVELEGLIKEQSTWFEFQFVDGQHDRANKALNFKVVFEESPSLAIVKLGSFTNGQWRRQRSLQGPLRPGNRFLIRFIVTNDSYKIIANGHLLDEFPQYLPPKKVKFLETNGDVILEKVHFTGY